MKASYVFLMIAVMTGCAEGRAEPQEVKATITGFGIAVAACMGGYTIETDSGTYRINSLPANSSYQYYEKVSFPASVWIRYKKATEGLCINFGPSIDITSIRSR